MFCLEAQSYLPTKLKVTKKEFFISDSKRDQTMFNSPLPVLSIPCIIPNNLFAFSMANNGDVERDPRFKMILWSIVAGTRGGVNRAKILNIIKDTPMNANKIATTLNLDHKTVVHHVKILSKNELIIKAEKEYAAEYQFTEIMKNNQSVLEDIMKKIGTK